MGRFLTDAYHALTDRLHRFASRVSVETRRMIVTAAVGLAILGGVLTVQIGLGDGETAPWRLAWWDTVHGWHHRSYDPEETARPVVLIEINDTTLAEVGPWPWSRSYLGELVFALSGFGAKAIALDVMMLHPDRTSPVQLAKRFRVRDPDLADRLLESGDTDLEFATVLQLTPTVIAAAGLHANDAGCLVAVSAQPLFVASPEDISRVTCFTGLIEPVPLLQDFSRGTGSISIRRANDGLIRRMPVLQTIEEELWPSLPLIALSIADGVDRYDVTPSASGLRLVPGTPDAGESGLLGVQLERDGAFWLHYRLPEPCRYINALQLWDPEFNGGAFVGREMRSRPDGEKCPTLAEQLEDAITFVSVTGQGSFDSVITPVGGPFVGTEVLAQAVEQMVDGTALRRFWWFFALETAALALLGLVVIVAVPRVAPGWSVTSVFVGCAVLLGVSWIGFRQGVLIDTASVALGTGLVAASVQAMTLISRDAEKRSVEIVAQRKDAELTAAKHMQESLLPARRYTDPGGRGEIACHIKAAREVGGDFYDYFPIDGRRLFFSVGDVSGKGMEASQFMLLSKTLWKSAALRADLPLDAIQETANTEIERDNPETMFVTAIVGVLDLETGALTYSSAGHDSPFVIDDGTVRQLEACGGPPAGLIDGIPYPAASVTLRPGARLVVFSDGISEAMDTNGALYGLDRLRAVLTGAPSEIPCADLRDLILDDVARFTGEAEQSDDITLVVVAWEGSGPGVSEEPDQVESS